MNCEICNKQFQNRAGYVSHVNSKQYRINEIQFYFDQLFNYCLLDYRLFGYYLFD